jgi:dihydroorotase
MSLKQFDGLEIPAPADFHVHLRDGPMMELVTPTIRQGGVNTVFVMVSNQLNHRTSNKNLNNLIKA